MRIFNNINLFLAFSLEAVLFTPLLVSANSNILNSHTSFYSGPSSANNLPDPEYLYIKAEMNGNNVFVNWAIASACLNAYFEVERSIDKKVFKTVALVLDGFATNDTDKTYKFKEKVTKFKKCNEVYYRLKQIDSEGSISYSAAVKVELANKAQVR